MLHTTYKGKSKSKGTFQKNIIINTQKWNYIITFQS
jgi:hypothetical protein